MNYNFDLYTIHMWLKGLLKFIHTKNLNIFFLYVQCDYIFFSPKFFLPLNILYLIPVKEKVDIYVHFLEILGGKKIQFFIFYLL
jgi:hypothetical protein